MQPKPVSDLDAHLGFWLRFVSNHVSQAFAARLGAQGVTVAEWVVLRALYDREPTAPSRLAAELGLTRGAITRLADRLIAKSLVLREADPEDGRAQTLSLSRRGVALVPDLAVSADRNDAEFFACLSETERATLENLMKRIVERNGLAALPVD